MFDVWGNREVGTPVVWLWIITVHASFPFPVMCDSQRSQTAHVPLPWYNTYYVYTHTHIHTHKTLCLSHRHSASRWFASMTEQRIPYMPTNILSSWKYSIYLGWEYDDLYTVCYQRLSHTVYFYPSTNNFHYFKIWQLFNRLQNHLVYKIKKDSIKLLILWTLHRIS